MSTLIENANRIYTDKEDIKQAIINKGVNVPDDTSLDGYANLISQISGSGGESGINFDKYVEKTWRGKKSSGVTTITVDGTPTFIFTGGCYDTANSGGSRSWNEAGIYDAKNGVGIGTHRVTNVDFETNTVSLLVNGSYTGYNRTFVFYE